MRQLFLLLYLCISDSNKVMIFILSEVLDLFSDMMWRDNNKIIAFGVKTCSYRHSPYLSRTFTFPTKQMHYCIAYKVAIMIRNCCKIKCHYSNLVIKCAVTIKTVRLSFYYHSVHVHSSKLCLRADITLLVNVCF